MIIGGIMNNKITNEDIENAKVILKPVFGIKPGIYLTIFYSIIILNILFLILIAPGLKQNGVKVFADTTPDGAVIYVDNVYMGTTPAVFFTKKGQRSFRIEKSYFETLEFNEDIGGRIIGTIFFPRIFHINSNIKLTDPEGFLKNRFKELSSYALIEDYYDRYQMPPLLSKTVREYISGSSSTETGLLYEFLYSMRVNLGSPEMVDEYVKAVYMAINSNTKNNSEKKENISIIFDYFENENNTEGILLSIIKAYPADKREGVLDSLSKIDNISINLNDIVDDFKNSEILKEPIANGKKITVNNLNFIGFTSGTFVSGSEINKNADFFLNDNNLISYPHYEYVDDFFIMDKEITRNDFFMFLEENPLWKVENINQLLSKKLVSKDYLALQDFTDKGSPIANISWYAATAYCEWLETKLPESLSEYRIKLPSEAEWEIAARLDSSGEANNIFKESGAGRAAAADFTRVGKTGLYDIAGNLWEWNDNWFFPSDSVNGLFGLGDSMFEGVEKAVRGGSWANSILEIDISTWSTWKT